MTATSAKADQPTHTLEPIVITPTKSLLGLLQDLRQVKIITREKIDELPVHSVAELLHYTLGVDIRQRGSWGIQADVNMRGANFEQVLICLNGLPINDPQTGHHNLDLPVRLADIERIEILPGGGSRLYGAGAFAGTINIITKSPAGSQIEVETSGGSFGLNAQGLSANFPLGNFQNRFSFAREESSGWRSETDFTAKNLSLNTQSSFSWGELGYLFGWTKKDFGADSFYSNFYTQEQEHTDTRFFNLKTLIKNQILALQSDLYFRRHTDHFLLDRTRPGWQENYHTSYSSGLDLDALKTFDFGSLLAGLEL
ncbi:MAG: TonB-dependent receptor, partial [Candidatus Omnitrophica bacterium]|nr:TonB-dependent receptor [Candidatus Omnitrophota bacterium]